MLRTRRIEMGIRLARISHVSSYDPSDATILTADESTSPG